ncbi:hybrid sensor histidine kinase/response regulator, partial [Allostreptomyces psammosilenae]
SAELESRQRELQRSNAELEEKAQLLEEQNQAIEYKNTEIEEARRVLEERAEQLALSAQYKSEFLANMSHELRTPLNSLLILARLLADNADGNLTPKQVEFADTIHGAGSDLLQLINDILDLSKVEAGRMDATPSPVPLVQLVEYVEATFQPLTAEKNLQFAVEVAPDVPVTLYTDDQRLQQVLRNLLSNAVKFTDRGSVELAIRPVREVPEQVLEAMREAEVPYDPDVQMLAFSVTDTGIGIARDKLRIIFEEFQQADGTTSRKYGGTGLGLSISRKMAQLLGGEIHADSELGRGSTFTLYLPERLPERPAGMGELAGAVLARTTPESGTDGGAEGGREAFEAVGGAGGGGAGAGAERPAGPAGGEPGAEAGAAAQAAPATGGQAAPGDAGGAAVAGADDDGPLRSAGREVRRARAGGPVGAGTTATAAGAPATSPAPSTPAAPAPAPAGAGAGQAGAGAQRAEEERRGTARRRPGHEVPRERLEGLKVLIVDDDVRNVFALTSALESYGLVVLYAENGREGIEVLQRNEDVAVVLMDIMMPEMDGYATTSAIRRMPQFAGLPIIALTAKAMKGDREKSLEAGANDHVTKPVDPVHLLGVLDNWLSGGGE